jgi:hypothetical protein
MEATTWIMTKKKNRERLANEWSGVAVLYVGAASGSKMKEKKRQS